MPRLTRRPAVLPETQAKICLFIRNGNDVIVAAALSGIHRDTFYDWLKRAKKGQKAYVAFRDAVWVAECQAEALKVANVNAAAVGGNWQAAMTWLERRRPERWAKTERLEHTGRGGRPIAIDMSKMTDDELAELAKTGSLGGRGEPIE